MNPRAYVLIFFFWSLLTILTPALLLLSDTSNPSSVPGQLPFNDENGGFQMSRKVVGLTRKFQMLKVLAEQQTTPPTIPTPITSPSPSPSPTTAPGAAVPVRRFMAGAGKVVLTMLKGLEEAQ
ncbi:uncharacterized protein LOC111491858 isoform X1 [Cucurbita maxima]|uniref:Uncharacterized protein LOC111491858 isoform X1 n=1 Tax=Cucurbita maxima TaxID=3661 RepID=A0A6J1K9F2_CUCMA|nr:uncharacterized protein LOC111491858 isoform X1 [Cucurbita maxima]